MALMSLEDAYKKAFSPQPMSLEEAYKKAFGRDGGTEEKPRMTLDEAYKRAFADRDSGNTPSLPGATVLKGLRRGTADTLGRKADVLAMNTAEIEHARDNTALEDIWGSNSLTQVEKAALIRAAQGDGGALEDMLQGRARMEGRLRRAADAADPGEYAPRKTAAGRFGQAIVENMPYTLMGLAENAPLALLGPAGAAIGGVMSAANEAQAERADVYSELKRRGMGHEEAYRQSDPVNWQNMAALSASNIAENLLTFAGNRIMPGAGRIARIAGTLAGNALMEGAEEGVQKLVSDKALGDKTDLEELLYEAGIGAASGALFGAGGMAADRLVNGRQAPVTAAGNVTDAEPDSQSQRPTEGQTSPTGTTMPSSQQEAQRTAQEGYAKELGQLRAAAENMPMAEVRRKLGLLKARKENGELTPELSKAIDEAAGILAGKKKEIKRQRREAREPDAELLESIAGMSPEGQEAILKAMGKRIPASKLAPSAQQAESTAHQPNEPGNISVLQPEAVATPEQDQLKAPVPAQMPVSEPAPQAAPQSAPPSAWQPSKADTVIKAQKLLSSPEPEGSQARKLYNETKSAAKTAGASEKDAQKTAFDAVIGSMGQGQSAVSTQDAVKAAREGKAPELKGFMDEHVAFVTVATPRTRQTEQPQAQTPESRMADIVAGKLERGESLGNNIEFARIGEEAYGTKRGEAGREAKDEYDAMELGVNKYIERRGFNPSAATAEQAKADLASIERDILSKLPNTERTRSAEQEQLQQFSTPPNLAYVANWLLGAGKGDAVLEPSAGVGGLLTFAKNAGAATVANEISGRRRALLSQMGFDAVHGVDASYIDSLLPKDVKPTKVIMNPPFSSGLIAGKKNDNAVGRTHVARALSKLQDGGRAVIILGKGMGMDTQQGAKFWSEVGKKHSVKAVVGIDGSNYRKYGTSFGVVMAVVDKTGPTTGPVISAKTDDLNQVIDRLEGVKGTITANPDAKETHPVSAEGEVRPGRYDSIRDLVKAALTPKGRNMSAQMWVDYAKVSDKNAEAIKEATGLDVSGYTRTLTGSDVEHIIRRHGEKGKALKSFPNQIPIRLSDFELLPDLLESPDSIERGTSDQGLDLIISKKKVGDRYIILEEVRSGRKKLVPKTIWKEIIDNDTEGPLHTSETFQPRKLADNASAVSSPRPGGSAEVRGSSEPTLSETTPSVTERGQNKATKSPHAGPKPKKREGGSTARDSLEDSVAPSKEIDKPLPRRRAEESMTVAQKSLAELQSERAAEASGQDDDQSLFESYVPQKLKVPGAKGHPADLAQSAAMASVEPPDVTYAPKLPKKMIDEGRLSEAQIEAITYAGQAFGQKNRDGTRRGFFIGDGTGVGKGREISGIITDQLARGHGDGKAVWVSEKFKLADDAKRDWEDIGNNPDDIFRQDRKTQEKGIMFTAYSLLRGKDGKRLEQLTDWLGEGFDGVIVLDEAHNANNIIEGEGGRGGFGKKRKASDTAKNIFALTQKYPDARVLYVSATGATEVDNLGMLDRLGLWGPGTAFGTRNAFLEQIKKGKKAAMELVARDMKALGLYISRTISFRRGKYSKEDVAYRRLEHALTEDQKALYDEIGRAWRTVFRNMDAALDSIAGEEKDPRKKRAARARAISQFWSAEQASFKGVIGAMKLPGMIADMKRELAKGNSVVVQLTQTGAAALDSAVGRMEDTDTYDDIDLTPKDALINFLKNSFPVHEYHEAVVGSADDGKPSRGGKR